MSGDFKYHSLNDYYVHDFYFTDKKICNKAKAENSDLNK